MAQSARGALELSTSSSRARGDFRPRRERPPRPAMMTGGVASKVKPAASKSTDPFPWDVSELLGCCAKPEPLPMGGCVLRNVLNDIEQKWLYEHLGSLPDPNHEDLQGLRSTATREGHATHNVKNQPQSFVTWMHPYSRKTNARQKPGRFLEWAGQLMHALAPSSKTHRIDSMLAQLYAPGGSLNKHRDEALSWGLIVSLGSPADFRVWADPAGGGEPQCTIVRSGDVVVGEWGQMPHAVTVLNEPPPAWWASVQHFGVQRRCSILLRQALSDKQQRKMAETRCQKLHGCSVAALSKQTGKDEEYLRWLLCQLNLNY